MIEIAENLYIGNELDYEKIVKSESGWAVVHACKEPYHRQALGYTSRGAPKEHPEYLYAYRGELLILNIVDTQDSNYIRKEIIDKTMAFIDEKLNNGKKVLVHCNQGESRSTSIGLLYIAMYTDLIPDSTFAEAENTYCVIYPRYNPKNGIRTFLMQNWFDDTNYVEG